MVPKASDMKTGQTEFHSLSIFTDIMTLEFRQLNACPQVTVNSHNIESVSSAKLRAAITGCTYRVILLLLVLLIAQSVVNQAKHDGRRRIQRGHRAESTVDVCLQSRWGMFGCRNHVRLFCSQSTSHVCAHSES